MDNNIICPICCEINGFTHINHKFDYSELIKNHSNIIWKNDSFTIIPSIGSLCVGHLLIVPNRHILSISNLNTEEIINLNLLKKKIRDFNIKNFQKQTEFFEHGTGCNINGGGSCISHAHLHIIPTNHSVINYLDKLNLTLLNQDELFIKEKNTKQGYLFIEDLNKNEWINNFDILPSQYMRKYYIKMFNKNENWDWRNNYNINTVIETINQYTYLKEYLNDLD